MLLTKTRDFYIDLRFEIEVIAVVRFAEPFFVTKNCLNALSYSAAFDSVPCVSSNPTAFTYCVITSTPSPIRSLLEASLAHTIIASVCVHALLVTTPICYLAFIDI